jgi:hypothetical protein
MTHDPREIERIVGMICPILHGNPPQIQGAVLADLFAMWLAGHFDGDGHTAELREQLITDWLATARKLVEPNERTILERTRLGSN